MSNAGSFYSKKRKIGKGNLHLTEHRLSRNGMWCVADNHKINMCQICAKRFLDLNFNEAVIDKPFQILTKLPQISHFH